MSLKITTHTESQEKPVNDQGSPVCSTSSSEHSAEQPDSPTNQSNDIMNSSRLYYGNFADHCSESFKRKSNICLSRENIMKSWTGYDDDLLLKLADQYKNDWKKIAKRIITNNKKKVTPNFLKNRYKEVAGDHIKKGVKFSHEEDLLIAQLFSQHNTQWTKIAEHFPDRTPVMIKNRYYSHIRRKGLLNDLAEEADKSVYRNTPEQHQNTFQLIQTHPQAYMYAEADYYQQAVDYRQVQNVAQHREEEERPYFEPVYQSSRYEVPELFEWSDELHTKVTSFQ